MDMLERSLTADDEAMDMERSLTTSIDNEVAQSFAAGGSLIWLLLLRLPSGQHNLEEEQEEQVEEAPGFLDRDSDDDGQDDDDDDDDAAYQFDDPEFVGYPTEETVQGHNYFNTVVILLAQQHEVDFETVLHLVFGEGAHGDGGAVAVAVPASDAAVASLEKHAFHATAEGRGSGCGITTGCAICLEDFDDGEEVTVMPCSRGHEFHTDCITQWLGKSNTCPLCRHALPTDVTHDDGL